MDKVKDAPAVTIRQPATANLMLDSDDRDATRNPTPFDFQITKPDAILNGFFNRIGTTEVVLEWNVPNISPQLSNNQINYTYNASSFSTTIAAGMYNVQEAMDAVAYRMSLTANPVSTLSGNPPFQISTVGTVFPRIGIANVEGAAFQFNNVGAPVNALPQQLFAPTFTNTIVKAGRDVVDLRPFRYIDFVSQQLTYNQDLKDASTAPVNRDVLNRWYFAYDQPDYADNYGYPIFMGTEPFRTRRTYNPPKQIKWNNIQPVGNVAFQLYDDDGNLMSYLGNGSNTNWLMTLQVSEN